VQGRKRAGQKRYRIPRSFPDSQLAYQHGSLLLDIPELSEQLLNDLERNCPGLARWALCGLLTHAASRGHPRSVITAPNRAARFPFGDTTPSRKPARVQRPLKLRHPSGAGLNVATGV
jgi:hypothetical protein